MADAILTRRSVVKNEYQLLADITISGSAATQIDITGLNLVKGEEYELLADIAHTTNGAVALFVNGNYTNTNYYVQEVVANGTSVSSGRQNKNFFVYGIGASTKTLSTVKIKVTNNGYCVIQSSSERSYGGSGNVLTNEYTTSTFTLTSITSLRISSEYANQIGIGSRFQLYKVGG